MARVKMVKRCLVYLLATVRGIQVAGLATASTQLLHKNPLNLSHINVSARYGQRETIEQWDWPFATYIYKQDRERWLHLLSAARL